MEEKTLLEYWLVLYRRKWLILFVTLSAMITAGVVSSMMTSVYEAKAVCFIPSKPDVLSYLSSSSEGNVTRSALIPVVSEETHAPYIGILKSKAIAEHVQTEFPYKTINDVMKDVEFSLSNEYFIQIYARDNDPENAAGIANAYVRYLNQLLGSYSVPLMGKNQAMIEHEIKETQGKLNKARQELKEFQEQNNILVLEEEKKQRISQKADFQSRLENTRVGLKENESKIAALKQEIEKEAELYVSSELILGSAQLIDLRRKLSDIEIQMASLKVDFKESHPNFIILQKQHDRVRENINIEAERLAKSRIKGPESSYEVMRRSLVDLLVEREKIQASLRAYSIVIDRIKDKLMEMPELFFKEDSLGMEISKYKNMTQILEVKLEEAIMQKNRELQVVVKVEEAKPPESPSFPIIWLNVLVAGVSGLVGGCFYSFFVSYLEDTREERIYRLVKAIEGSEDE